MLLLDEPAAGVPTTESRELFETIAQLPREVTILLIEHDMDLVFRFADRISVLVSGALLTEGAPDVIADDARVKQVYLGARRRMAELLRDATRSGPATATRSCSRTSASALERRRQPGAARPQRHGQDDAARDADGRDPADPRRDRLRRAATSTALPGHRRARAGLGWVPQERDIFPSLTVEENLSVVAPPGTVGPGARLRDAARGCRSAAATWATSFPAASSRCSRSAAR